MRHDLRARLGSELLAVRVALARVGLVAVLVAAGTAGWHAAVARADGDPASDVLAARTLFLPADARVSASQQAQVQGLLRAAGHAGFPIQVAVITSGYDLGSVTALWHRPRTYARFLGIELSLIHKQPLLVVMPNGFGFNWPGHSTAAAYRLLSRIPIGSDRAGLVTATRTAVRTLAAADGRPIAAASGPTAHAPGRGSSDDTLAIIAAAVAALAAAAGARVLLGRRGRRRAPPAAGGRRAFPGGRGWAVPGIAALCCVATGVPILAVSLLRHAPAASRSHVSAVATPYTWPAGRRRAPRFNLRGANGAPVSLTAYRGRPVIVTFIDPLCRNLCPLAAHVLNQVDRDLPVARRPVIIAVSVDVYANSRADLREDFRRWDLVPQWHWAVGTHRQLAAVWRRYHVGVSVKTKTVAGTTVHFITHDEVAFIVDGSGYVRALYGWPYYPQNVETALRRLT